MTNVSPANKELREVVTAAYYAYDGDTYPSALDAALAAAGQWLAERLEARALNAGRIIRNPGQEPLCGFDWHDDRWCSDCDRMEVGMDKAADLLRCWCGVAPQDETENGS